MSIPFFREPNQVLTPNIPRSTVVETQPVAFTPPPPASEWAWVNQGAGATIEDVPGGVKFTIPATSHAEVSVLQVADLPDPPFTITVAFTDTSLPGSNNTKNVPVAFGIMMNAVIVSSCLGATVFGLVNTFANPDIWGKNLYYEMPLYYTRFECDESFNGPPDLYNSVFQHYGGSVQDYTFGHEIITLGVHWLRLHDDGTNTIFSASQNGVDWVQVMPYQDGDLLDEPVHTGLLFQSAVADPIVDYTLYKTLVHWEVLDS